MTLLTTNTPFMLGFDSLERILERAAKCTDAYPPYNIEQLDASRFQITLAVAGFAEEDLSVELQNKQLIIRGHHREEACAERRFLHKGIASRQFQRTFVLADGIEIQTASLDNGLLKVDLVQIEPETNVRQIKITKKQKKETGNEGKNNPKS